MWPTRGLEARCTSRRFDAPRAWACAPDAARSRPLRAALRALRRAGRRRRTRRARRRTRRRRHAVRASSSATSGGVRREPARRNRRDASRAIRRSIGCAQSIAALRRSRVTAAAHHRLRLFPPQSRRPERARSPIICTRRPRNCRASGCGRCAPAGGAGDRRHRAAAGLPGQRPARHHAGRRRANLSQPLRRAASGRRVVVVTACDDGLSGRARSASGGAAIAAVADVRPQIRERPSRRARAAGIEVLAGATVARHRGRPAGHGDLPGQRRWRRSQAADRRIACDAVLMSGGFTPSVHLFSQSRGKLAWDESIQAFVPGRLGANANARRAPAAASTTSRRPWRTARRPARRRSPEIGRCRGTAGVRHSARIGATRRGVDRRPRHLGALPAESARQAQGLRRLPARRDRAATSSSPRARASARSSTSSATPRPEWRPTRARPPT